MIKQQTPRYIIFILIFIAPLLSGCASINYYAQSIQGQYEVIQKRQDINDLLKKKDISDTLRRKLNTVSELREFSIKQLGLPENKSYLSYTDLERDYVVWNIFATEEFSLTPLKWCYWIVGCLDYRGYFAESDARKHAQNLEEKGHDVYLGGVSAYSTLGWFDDPVLNTMLRWNEIRLATVIFHELAHQQLYIKNDTEFNESYAEAIAIIGVRKWLGQKAEQQQHKEYVDSQAQDKQFTNLVMKYKSLLNKLYQSGQSEQSEQSMRTQKKALFDKMRNEHNALKQNWSTDAYAGWFSTELNNAKLAAVVTYKKYVPAFIEIYEKLNDLNKLYTFVKQLSNCSPIKRRIILKKRAIEIEC